MGRQVFRSTETEKRKKANDNKGKWKDGVGKLTCMVLTHSIYVTRAPWSHEGVYGHAWRTECELQLSHANRCVSVWWMSDSLSDHPLSDFCVRTTFMELLSFS